MAHEAGKCPVVLGRDYVEGQHLEPVQDRLHASAPRHLDQWVARDGNAVLKLCESHCRYRDLVGDLGDLRGREVDQD